MPKPGRHTDHSVSSGLPPLPGRIEKCTYRWVQLQQVSVAHTQLLRFRRGHLPGSCKPTTGCQPTPAAKLYMTGIHFTEDKQQRNELSCTTLCFSTCRASGNAGQHGVSAASCNSSRPLRSACPRCATHPAAAMARPTSTNVAFPSWSMCIQRREPAPASPCRSEASHGAGRLARQCHALACCRRRALPP